MTLKSSLHLVFPMFIVLAGAGLASAQLLEPEPKKPPAKGTYSRTEIPGHYTVGFYADERGSSSGLELPDGQDRFEAWLGITGDSTRVFSGLVMRLDLPYGVKLDGPIAWIPRTKLKETGSLLGDGMTLEFQYDCAQLKSAAPVMLGRVRFRMQPGVNEAMLTPAPHKEFGLSVELCSDDDGWPKPYADPVSLSVRRSRSFWDRLTGWFN